MARWPFGARRRNGQPSLGRSPCYPSEMAKPRRDHRVSPTSAAVTHQTEADWWTLPIDQILNHEITRIDAPHYVPRSANLLETRVKPLAALAKLSLPNRFERVWAADGDHGTPYLNATDLLPLMALGEPAQARFLSDQSNTDIDKLIIREGWLLMTCSGTIGRTYYVPRRLDGWAATHDLVRIVPDAPKLTGYLLAWCMTESARQQVHRHMHGGQITHVTAEQVGELQVPMLSPKRMATISSRVMHALDQREAAINTLKSAWRR